MTEGERLFEEGHGPVTFLLTSECLHWIDGGRALGRQKSCSESDNYHTSYRRDNRHQISRLHPEEKRLNGSTCYDHEYYSER